MSHLNDMALFVEVARARSFRKAAEALGMPNSTLSRRISELEKAIGLRLLHRTTRKIELTEAGQLYYERSKRIVDEARLAHEQLGAMLEQPSGVLRVSLPVDLAIFYLTPIIGDFARHYPGITFEFDLTPRRVDLAAEPFDVAIRIGKLEDSSLITRLIGRHSRHLYASPGYIEASGEPATPADLAKHECIGMLRSPTWTLHQEVNKVDVAVRGRAAPFDNLEEQTFTVGRTVELEIFAMLVAVIEDVVRLQSFRKFRGIRSGSEVISVREITAVGARPQS
ncbi:LysR family transcriptional regulator [Rhizobium sp. 007]|uniref:LysR family transcriptional regulator n=1 Tax=Rhizobium sp. 007 TaxID=2785056 RepID=UPI001FEE95BC|nr:LysR family transcriptional regulator [Rhizobium sp. 007]